MSANTSDRPLRSDARASRATLLAAAKELVAENGLDALTVVGVAQGRPQPQHGLPAFQAEREELVDAVGAQFARESALRCSAEPRELGEQIDFFTQHFRENPDIARIWMFHLLRDDDAVSKPGWDEYVAALERLAESPRSQDGIDAEMLCVIGMTSALVWSLMVRQRTSSKEQARCRDEEIRSRTQAALPARCASPRSMARTRQRARRVASQDSRGGDVPRPVHASLHRPSKKESTMEFDLMTGGLTWKESAELAVGAGVGRLLRNALHRGGQRSLDDDPGRGHGGTDAHVSAPASRSPFPRSPMISAQVAWEMAATRRVAFVSGWAARSAATSCAAMARSSTSPHPQMRDYVGAFKACIRAFRGEEKLAHEGPYYSLSLLPPQWAPPRHDFEDVKIDISAVGPLMCRVAGELCDGVHVHPMHSMPYLQNRSAPGRGRRRSPRGPRAADEIDLIVPVFAIPGDTPEERERATQVARTQIAFYGSTPNYAFQFDDLGFRGNHGRSSGRMMKGGDVAGMAEHDHGRDARAFLALSALGRHGRRTGERYAGVAARVVSYLAMDDLRRNPKNLARWGEISTAVRSI